ncbi:hypothetical protein KR026_006274, partial [Drosophila bipectinata]
ICTKEPKVEGECKEQIKGYSYVANRNRCRKLQFKACSVTGNFFPTMDSCKSKCLNKSAPEREKNFMAFIDRTMSQFISLLNSFINFVFL